MGRIDRVNRRPARTNRFDASRRLFRACARRDCERIAEIAALRTARYSQALAFARPRDA
jgi:hypothetical protein